MTLDELESELREVRQLLYRADGEELSRLQRLHNWLRKQKELLTTAMVQSA